ncbi:TPA: hypothetical protein ACT9NA_001974, partial [Legionella pneumophila]
FYFIFNMVNFHQIFLFYKNNLIQMQVSSSFREHLSDYPGSLQQYTSCKQGFVCLELSLL